MFTPPRKSHGEPVKPIPRARPTAAFRCERCPLFFLFTAIISIFNFTQAGCRSDRAGGLPPEDVNNRIPTVSNRLDVDIYLDATLSMKGFIVSGTSSYYEQALQLLERAVGSGWKEGRIQYYKFGSLISPIEGRDHLQASQPRFYTNPEYLKRTHIENVIAAANPTNLTVVVTDLFQNDADINLVTAKLKEKYLAKNSAIGILGVKSQFDGTVYDVGIRNYSFKYVSGEQDPERFRPFYVLMLGRHADIQQYHEKLISSGLREFPVKYFTIFSRYLGESVASFERGKLTSIAKMVEVGDLMAPGQKDGRVKQFRIRDNSEAVNFSAILEFRSLPHTMPYDGSSLDPEIAAWKSQSDQLADSPQAARALNIKNAALSGESLKVDVDLTPPSLPGSGIYCFRAILRPKNYQPPQWVADWDMPTSQIEAWRLKPDDFNGATTFNLKPFLSDLREAVLQLRPKVGELYWYVRKK